MSVVDVHGHCVPVGLVATLQREGAAHGVEVEAAGRPGVYTLRIAGERTPRIFPGLTEDLERRGEERRAAAIDLQVWLPWINLCGYRLPPADGAWLSRAQNEALARSAADAGGAYLAFGSVPLQDAGLAVAELRHVRERLGMRGVQIGSNVAGRELDQGLDPFWEAAEGLGALIVLHPYDVLGAERQQRFGLDKILGNPLETSLAAAMLIFGGVLERFPRLRLCLSHAGGTLPWQLGRLDRGYHASAELRSALPEPPSFYFRRFYFDTIVHRPEVLRLLLDWVAAEQVLLGTDYPYDLGDLRPLGTLDAVPRLGEGERARIAGGNAAALLGL